MINLKIWRTATGAITYELCVSQRAKKAEFMQKLLTLVLEWGESVQPPEIDWAHRAPIPRPNPWERPRAILARFLHSADRELILHTARNKSELFWEGNRIMIFPDFSRATQLKLD